MRAILGFDLLHALRQRDGLRRADIVWTHTESQYLAVAAVLLGRGPRPKILGQSVWLFDHWHRLNPVRRWLFRRLIQDVDVLTVHSSANLSVACAAFPKKKVLRVLYGISSERPSTPSLRANRPLRVLAPGSDRHRDWSTLASAIDGLPDASAFILSGTAPRRLARGRPNLHIERARTNADLSGHYAKASVVCVPLKQNLHASGITVIQEAVLAGVPVVASDTGGLQDYFGPDMVRFVPPGDPVALRSALEEIVRDPQAAFARAARAQEHMRLAGIGAEAFVRRHVEVSRELLGR